MAIRKSPIKSKFKSKFKSQERTVRALDPLTTYIQKINAVVGNETINKEDAEIILDLLIYISRRLRVNPLVISTAQVIINWKDIRQDVGLILEHLKKGDPSKAYEEFEKIILFDPSSRNAEILHHL